jgi:aminoglycoside phosphotransferase (APT) family kinase protein
VTEHSVVIVQYSHEPIDTFADKIRVLLGQLFVDAHSPSIAVYRLQGGSFHCVIAAEVLDRAVVIRIPRFEYVPLADEAAILSFVRSHSQLPVPHILKIDVSASNVLGDPYMIQMKVPGDKLYHLYPTMTFEERCSVVRQVAHMLGKMFQISMPSIGVLKACIDDGHIVVGPFKDTRTRRNTASILPPAPTFLRFLPIGSIST